MSGLSVGVGATLSPFDRREFSALVRSLFDRLRIFGGLLGCLGVCGFYECVACTSVCRCVCQGYGMVCLVR